MTSSGMPPPQGYSSAVITPIPCTSCQLRRRPRLTTPHHLRHAPVLALMMLLLLLAFFTIREGDPASSSEAIDKPPRWAVVNFVDGANEYLWGVYSTHVQLEKFEMTPSIDHVAMVSQDISEDSRALLVDWLGKEQVLDFDREEVLSRLEPQLRGRPGVFLKLVAFNLTQYDKLIVLDNDVFVRQSIMHWFDYPAPAATGAKGRVEWNSGAMVIEPSKALYAKLLEYLSKVGKWDPENDSGVDVFDSNAGHQGYLSSFFTSNITSHTMFTMSIGSSILSSSLDGHPENEYLWKYRPNAFETIHFTNTKPWKVGIKPSHPVNCAMLREWKESVRDAPTDKLVKLPNFLKHCPPR